MVLRVLVWCAVLRRRYYGGGYYGGGYDGGYYGAVRLKVKPNQAEVLVDGYYVGIVDEFDNPFQQLHLESGPHRIEVREDGYEPVTFEVRIVPERPPPSRRNSSGSRSSEFGIGILELGIRNS